MIHEKSQEITIEWSEPSKINEFISIVRGVYKNEAEKTAIIYDEKSYRIQRKPKLGVYLQDPSGNRRLIKELEAESVEQCKELALKI